MTHLTQILILSQAETKVNVVLTFCKSELKNGNFSTQNLKITTYFTQSHFKGKQF